MKMHLVNNVRPFFYLPLLVARPPAQGFVSASRVLLLTHAQLFQAIDEIGWTNYHMKLFILNGFG